MANDQVSIYDVEGVEEEVRIDESPLDDTNINSYLVYYNDDDMKEFKTCLKNLMRTTGVANVSIVILNLLKQNKNGGNTETTEKDHGWRCGKESASSILEGRKFALQNNERH